jgi:thiol-disulfide isomerase/thioredoxin
MALGSGGAKVAEPIPGFWALQWRSPQDASVPMAQFQGRPLLINFWATWCPPCVEELPLLDRFAQEQGSRGVQVLGLAVDRKDAVLPFLARSPLRFVVALAGMEGAELGRSLGNSAGGLPFSVLIASDGSVAQRKMGRLSADDLAAWAAVK